MFRTYLSTRPRFGRTVLALASMVVVAVGPTSARAGVLGFGKVENLMWFGQVATHGPAAPAHGHFTPGLPNVFWNSPFGVRTWAFPPGDRVAVNMFLQHRVAPHAGEPAPGPAWAPLLMVRAIPIPRWIGAAAFGAPMHGPFHADFFSTVLLARCAPPGVIRNFIYIASGRHDPGQCTALAAICTGEAAVPPTTSESAAGAALVFDAGTNELAISVAASGISRYQLLHAAIHIGPPGQAGPPILELGGPAEWEELEDGTITRMLSVPFPPEYIPLLLDGQTYVNLATQQYPQGEVRGQLMVPPPSQYQIGDLNCDGAVNFDDINPFVLAVSNPAAYEQAFPECPILAGDINVDGEVNFDDINPFVALLSGQ